MRLNYDPLELIAGGIANKNDKVLLWRLEFRRLYPQLLQQGAASSLAQSAVTLAEAVGKDLTEALKSLFRNWITSNGSGKSASTAEVSKLLQSTQAMAHYWAALEPEFWALVDQLSNGLSPDVATSSWGSTLQQTIRQAWQHATDQLGRDGRGLAAAARADRDLGRVITGAKGAVAARNNKTAIGSKGPARSSLPVNSS
jgi:hypothetical protein